jgi:hypothetical protein
MKRLALVAVVAALSAGCASGARIGGATDGRLARADALARDARTDEARDLYEQIAREPATGAAPATALYRLGRLHADPSSGLLDHAAALDAFERLVADHPASPWAPEARAWRTALLEIRAREAEAARLRREVARLEADLKAQAAQAARLTGETGKLRAEASRLREEAAKLRADLERLKRIDLKFERRR